MEKNSQVHNIPPLYDAHSRVLILGSFPSVKSREAAFFYAHPQNRFWPTLAAPCGTPSARARSRARRMRASRTLCRMICASFWTRRTSAPSSATAGPLMIATTAAAAP